jgi:hypothetical protein
VRNAMTIDVEDYFQAAFLQRWLGELPARAVA